MELATEIWHSTLQLMYQKSTSEMIILSHSKHVMAHFENQYENENFCMNFFPFFTYKHDKKFTFRETQIQVNHQISVCVYVL